jgi:hypothetical protein
MSEEVTGNLILAQSDMIAKVFDTIVFLLNTNKATGKGVKSSP